MTTYIGYNTINQVKNFGLTDTELVKRDLLNALSIREGELPGKPEIGTSIWNYIFEPNVPEVERKIESEIQRIIDADPRIESEEINVYSENYNILLELNVRILPNVDLILLNILFDSESNSVKFTL